MAHRSDEVRRAIEQIAWAQAGAISRTQLIAAGLSARGIYVWVANGRLRALWPRRGVYALGHVPLNREGQLHAALLLGGDGAAPVRGRTALRLHCGSEGGRVPT